VEIHYAIGGTGEPVLLLHGVPKTMSYWRHIVPLLTPHYTVIVVDNRGFGGSERPLSGYDTATMAGDVAELATHLGFEEFRIAGEDWGAAIAYAVAAFHRPRVRQLVFQETLLPGLPAGERDPSLAPDDGRTGWHFSFFSLPNLPELLLAGRERPFWTYFARRQMWDPSALAEEDIDEMVHSAEQPGSSRKWPATSAAPSSPHPVTTSRWRTRLPWPRPTSTSSQAAKPRGGGRAGAGTPAAVGRAWRLVPRRQAVHVLHGPVRRSVPPRTDDVHRSGGRPAFLPLHDLRRGRDRLGGRGLHGVAA